MTDDHGGTSASRLSDDEEISHRLITDSGKTPDSSVEPKRATLRSRYEPKWLHTITSKYALVLVWAAMALFFYILMPDIFGSMGTFSSIFGSQQVLVFLGLSAMLTLIVGEIDLSIASIMGLGATLIVVLAGTNGMNIWLACLVAMVACLIAGAINAFFVVALDVSSIVVTLGTGTFLIGIAEWISDSSISSIANPTFAQLANFRVLGLPISFYYGIAVALLLFYMLGWTPVGRHMMFVGANREVARLAGIRVQRVRVGAYLFGSLLAGLAGLLLVASVGGFDSGSSTIYLLPALAAVFLGTAVAQPGQFNPIGTLIAIYFLATGIFGLQLLGFTGWIQNAFYGGGLVIAVALAKILRSRAKSV